MRVAGRSRLVPVALIGSLVALPIPVSSVPVVAQSGACPECKAESLGRGWRLDNVGTNNLNVCLVGTTGNGVSKFSQGVPSETEGIKKAFKYWSDYLATNSQFPQLTFAVHNNPGGEVTCHITFHAVDRPPEHNHIIANANGSVDGSGINVQVNDWRLKFNNPNPPFDENFWAWAMAGEVGHLMDFEHFSGNCDWNKTVMFDETPSNNPGSLPSALCADKAAITEKFKSGEQCGGVPERLRGGTATKRKAVFERPIRTADDLPSECEQLQEEDYEYETWICTAHWNVTHYFYWTGTGWALWFSDWELMYVDNCYPLPDG